MRVRRALLSVSDKTGIVDFARGLEEMNVEILSTGGTASLLRSEGVRVTDVATATGFPEIMAGRVKTLHPKIHGGILAKRDDESHQAAMDEHGIGPIDLVCVNLYPFEQTVAKPDCTRDQAVEQIDIGGPTMIRSAAKNHAYVAVVTNPRRYQEVLDAMRASKGEISEDLRRALALSAFRRTAQYDAAIANFLADSGESDFPDLHAPFFEKTGDLRYGENPHQKAAVYSQRGSGGPSVTGGDLLWGKELSYNNLLDLDAALRIARAFSAPGCVVIKHTNPCGAAVGETQLEAFTKAMAGDPMSAFGCVLGFNRVVDAETAKAVAVPEHFIECIVAPGFDPQAINTLTSGAKWGKSVRLLKLDDFDAELGPHDRDIRRVLGGLLVQDYDKDSVPEGGARTVSEREPTDAERADLEFAWQMVKHVQSNAIVLVKDRALVGVGAGQMSRVDAAMIAVRKAGDRVHGAVLASDAFFPFADGLEVATSAGVVAAVEPGGSRNDHEVIESANASNTALLFTGMRHFRH